MKLNETNQIQFDPTTHGVRKSESQHEAGLQIVFFQFLIIFQAWFYGSLELFNLWICVFCFFGFVVFVVLYFWNFGIVFFGSVVWLKCWCFGFVLLVFGFVLDICPGRTV